MPLRADAPDRARPVLDTLARIVVKQGVSLGGLSPSERAQVFALVWVALPDDTLSERDLNAQLLSQLEAAAAFVATDHVELRRWLVDAGWLHRDGYGHAYRRTELAGLAPTQRVLAAQLAGLDVQAWVSHQRSAHEARREARRLAWQHQQLEAR